MIFLRVATYYYIVQMHFMETNNHVSAAAKPIGLTPGLTRTDLSYGSLEDPLEGMLGHKDIKIQVLDYVSAALPAIFLVGTMWQKDLQLWTKMLLANSMLALWKGTLGMATIVPDSIGWKNCKARLGKEGLDYYQDHIGSPFTDGFLKMFSDIVKLEFTKPQTRFCADMLYSGHTYFTCLYALGILELVRRSTMKLKSKKKLRSAIIVLFSLLVLGEQLAEIYLVLLDRFHYTMDVLAALLMVFLWYTNGPLAIASKWWSSYPASPTSVPVPAAQRIEELRQEIASLQGIDARDEGDIWVPVCCVPFCCLWGYHHVVSTKHLGGDLEDILSLDPEAEKARKG
jgi:hypothetical protein